MTIKLTGQSIVDGVVAKSFSVQGSMIGGKNDGDIYFQ